MLHLKFLSHYIMFIFAHLKVSLFLVSIAEYINDVLAQHMLS